MRSFSKRSPTLLEFPTAVLGDIEARYLALPREVLITAMRRHQRFFSVKNANGEILPHFIAFSNTEPEDLSFIRQGNERVLRARLSDAEFFFREDVKKPLETFVESLKGVIFQNTLGDLLREGGTHRLSGAAPRRPAGA